MVAATAKPGGLTRAYSQSRRVPTVPKALGKFGL